MNKQFLSRSSILLTLFGSTILTGIFTQPLLAHEKYSRPAIQTALQNRESQPSMQQALSSLTEAQRQLQRATYDKGGHRIKALELVQQAVKETQQGIAFDNANSSQARISQETQRRSVGISQSSESQPSMQQALSSLTEAQRQLQRATSDKGGHRIKALELVAKAVKETLRGIEYDNTHNDDNREDQQNMLRALSSLAEAQKWIQSATPDKGGHRVKALELIQQAARETQRGIEFDRSQGRR